MPTLHTVTEKTKKILKILAIIAAIIAAVFIIFRIGIFIRDTFFPVPPEPPNVKFGKLGNFSFPESTTDGLSYSLDTVTGALPIFTDENKLPIDRINVYKINNPKFSLLDLQNSKEIVSKVGFLGKEISTDEENVYFWSAISSGLQREIEMNIVNKSFDYSSSFRQSSRVLAGLNMPDRIVATETAMNFLDSMGLFPTDIDDTKTRTELLAIDGTELFTVDTLREAQVIRVNFYQNDVNNLPVFYENPPFSSLNFYVTGGEKFNTDVVEGNFYHQIITEESATYPLKSVQEAYEELKNGEGYVATSYLPDKEIKIKEVVLGYYLATGEQNYLIPIYVFKGLDDAFFAYVVAVPEIWFGE